MGPGSGLRGLPSEGGKAAGGAGPAGGRGAQGWVQPGAGQGVPRGRDRPAPLRAPAASRYTKADVPAAQQGAGPHLPAQDRGLESSRRAARTCPAGRHHGVSGESNRKIPDARGCEEEEGGSRCWMGVGGGPASRRVESPRKTALAPWSFGCSHLLEPWRSIMVPILLMVEQSTIRVQRHPFNTN